MGWIRVYTSQTQKGDAGIWGNLPRALQPPLESGLGLCFWSLGRLQGVSQSSRTWLPVLTYESFCPANTSVQFYDVLNKIPWLAWGSLPFLFKVCTLYSVHCWFLRQHDDSIVQSWFSVPVEWQGFRCAPCMYVCTRLLSFCSLALGQSVSVGDPCSMVTGVWAPILCPLFHFFDSLRKLQSICFLKW